MPWHYTVGGLWNGGLKIICAAVNCDMYSPITASKMLRVSVKRIKEERGKTAVTISKLTGMLAYCMKGKNVSSAELLSGTVHLSGEGWGGEREAGGQRGARGVITAMLRPEREICTHRD